MPHASTSNVDDLGMTKFGVNSRKEGQKEFLSL